MNETQRQHMAQRLRTPAGAVAAVASVRQNAYDLPFLHSLSSLAADPECWQCLRDAGIVDLFVDMIMLTPVSQSGEHSDDSQHPPQWPLPLTGLFNCLVGIRHSPGSFEGSENQEPFFKIIKASPPICLRLFLDQKIICTSEVQFDDLRCTVALWIQAIWGGTNMLSLDDTRSELKNSHVVNIATWCWVYASSNEHRSKAANVLMDIIEQPQATREILDQVIASAGSYDQFFTTIHRILQDAEITHDHLAENMSLLIGFTSHIEHTELAQRFSRMKTHHEVVAALRRQLTRQSGGEAGWRVLEHSVTLVINMVHEAASPTDELTSLISHQSLIPLLGGLSLRFLQASKESPSWSRLMTLLKHTYTCTSPSCRIRTSPSYAPILRTHLSWRWWPTLKRMRFSNSEASTKFQSEWVMLGRIVGLQEASERQKDELGGGEAGIFGCWWAECVKLVHPCDPSLNASLRRCSGCKKALYCTSDCQARDWKGHKKQCTIWKAAVAVP